MNLMERNTKFLTKLPGRISLPLAGLVLLCLAATTLRGDLQRSDYSQSNLGSLKQPAPGNLQTGAIYSVTFYPLYPPQLEPGQGRELVEAYCNTCHSVRYITMQPPLPAATWDAEVNKMIQTFGMTNPEGVAPQITKYLQEHYTPGTRKH
jgi:hypothetical protein